MGRALGAGYPRPVTTTVQDNPDRARFEVLVDGRLAGIAQYVLEDTTIELTHTEVADELEGEGLAQRLAETALGAARDAGLAVLPSCPFTAEYIKRNPEHLDLVPEDRRADFRLV